MKVAWFSHTGRIGGAEICLHEVIEALGAAGVASAVAVPEPGPLVDEFTGLGVPTIQFPFDWWVGRDQRLQARANRARRNLLALSPAIRWLREYQPEVVVSNTLTIPVGAFAARRLGIPHIWYVHEFGEEDHGLVWDWGAALSLRTMGSLSRQVVVNSDAVGAKFSRAIPQAKLRRIYYAVEVPELVRAEPPADHEFRIACVGMKSPGKRQEDAVRALGLLAAKGSAAQLTLVGGAVPDYQQFLDGLIGELGVGDRVQMVGQTDDPYSYVAAAHAAVVCSRAEAFGRVTVEAMKLGRPVVGAASGGTLELIRDGWNGFLYRPGDAEDLADKLRRLEHDPALRTTLGENARCWATAQFNRERFALEWNQVLGEAVGARPGRPSPPGPLSEF